MNKQLLAEVASQPLTENAGQSMSGRALLKAEAAAADEDLTSTQVAKRQLASEGSGRRTYPSIDFSAAVAFWEKDGPPGQPKPLTREKSSANSARAMEPEDSAVAAAR